MYPSPNLSAFTELIPSSLLMDLFPAVFLCIQSGLIFDNKLSAKLANS